LSGQGETLAPGSLFPRISHKLTAFGEAARWPGNLVEV